MIQVTEQEFRKRLADLTDVSVEKRGDEFIYYYKGEKIGHTDYVSYFFVEETIVHDFLDTPWMLWTLFACFVTLGVATLIAILYFVSIFN